MTMIDYKHLKAIIVLCILWPVHGKRKPTWRINSILGDVGLRDVRFGYSVAIDGDSIIVGEPGWPGIVPLGEQPNRTQPNRTGSVSFYRKAIRSKVTQPPWVLQNRINTTNVITRNDAQLGLVVAIAGDYAAATALTELTDYAEVHIFHRNATNFWNFDFKIAQPGGDVANSGFGQSLAMTENLIVIGAVNNVYLFERTGGTWAQITFTKPVLPATALFGASVALDVNATLIAVGAPGEINGANSLKTGAVYLFEFVTRRRLSGTDAVARQLPPAAGGWLNSAILFASDSANDDQFGLAVAVNKKRVLVGAPEFDFYGTNSGSAYVFNLTAGVWTQEQKLMPLLASGDVFGGSVTIDNGAKDILVVGADHVDTFGDDGGVIFVYEYNARTFQWIPTERSRFHAGGNEFLGVSVDISNGVVVAGAWGVDGKGYNTDKGNAFVYAKQKCPFLLPMRCQKNGF